MSGKPPGPLVLGVLRALKQHHELTRAELCVILGVNRFSGSAVISRMAKKQKTVGKRVYVKYWVHDDGARTRRYPKAVYALGPWPDAPKPSPKTQAENSRAWREKEKSRVSSVFAWGRSRQARAAIRRGGA